MAAPAIEVCDLTFRYNHGEDPVFDGLSLKLPAGSRCLMVGSNGAGKSTFLRILAGVHMVPEKAVLVHGRSAFHDTLFSNMNVAFLGDVWHRTVPWVSTGVPYSADVPVWQMVNNIKEHDPVRRDRLVQILDINPEWRMHAVSDGQRKRVMIMLKLLRPYSVLLLDEVTTHLDVISRQDFLDFLRAEAEDRGATIVYATHIFDGLEDWASHMIYLSKGRVQRFSLMDEVTELKERRAKGESSALMRVVEKWLRDERKEEGERPKFTKFEPQV